METDFSFILLMVVAVVAYSSHVPLSPRSSPEGFISLGTSCRRRFPLIERGIGGTSVFVLHINVEV